MLDWLLVALLELRHIHYAPTITRLPTESKAAIVRVLMEQPRAALSGHQQWLPPTPRSQLLQPSRLITAVSAVVIDPASGFVLWEKNPDEALPIASLTKLVTATVFLQYGVPFETEVAMEPTDRTDPAGATLYVEPGERVTVGNLFYSGLVGSANNAIKALARSTGDSELEFVDRMNATAIELGLQATHFQEMTGLDPANVSTVKEYGQLAAAAMRQPLIRNALTLPEYSFETLESRPHRIRNTNALVRDGELHLLGAKTGYLDEAGYTYAALASNEHGREVLVVLFRSTTSESRFAEAKALVEWGFGNFTWW